MSLWLILLLPIIGAGVLGRWIFKRRQDFFALRWPEAGSDAEFQSWCMRYLAWRGCELTNPARVCTLVRKNGIVLFTGCLARVPFDFELDNIRHHVSKFRGKQENGGGLFIISCAVPHEVLVRLAGTYVRAINYRELADLDRLLRVAKMPFPEQPLPPLPELKTDAWDLLTAPVREP